MLLIRYLGGMVLAPLCKNCICSSDRSEIDLFFLICNKQSQKIKLQFLSIHCPYSLPLKWCVAVSLTSLETVKIKLILILVIWCQNMTSALRGSRTGHQTEQVLCSE